MSIFGTIMSKIFHTGEAHAAPAPAPSPTPAAPAGPTGDAPAPSAPTAPAAPAPGATPTAAGPVDVAAVLDKLDEQTNETLDWRHSIVDLMKLLKLDSSLANRKALAAELHYAGDTNDSATMNIWLHKQVMQKLADNGGTVPADLRD